MSSSNAKHLKKPAKKAASLVSPETAAVRKVAKASNKVAKKGKRSFTSGATVQSSARGPQASFIKSYRRILIAELMLCIIIILLMPKAAEKTGKKVPTLDDILHRLVSISIVFFILGLVTAIGTKFARVASGIGGLVTLTLLIGKQDEIVYLFGAAAKPSGTAIPTTQNLPPLSQDIFSTQPGESSPFQNTPVVSGPNPPAPNTGEPYPTNAGIPGFYQGLAPIYDYTESGTRPVRTNSPIYE